MKIAVVLEGLHILVSFTILILAKENIKKSITKKLDISKNIVEKVLTEEDRLFVTIDQGTVKGLKNFTPKGKKFYSYHGIPFAKPPTGDLRFKVIFYYITILNFIEI